MCFGFGVEFAPGTCVTSTMVRTIATFVFQATTVFRRITAITLLACKIDSLSYVFISSLFIKNGPSKAEILERAVFRNLGEFLYEK